MTTMVPLLAVALLIWGGVFFFLLSLDRKVKVLEQQLERHRRDDPQQGEKL